MGAAAQDNPIWISIKGDLFSGTLDVLTRLEGIIRNELQSLNSGVRLKAWSVSLLDGGFHNASGWVEERKLRLLTQDHRSHFIHGPSKGDIVIFPSSLHHDTIPFESDSEVCFDMMRSSVVE